MNMPLILFYLLKLSVSLSVVYLFYQSVLRRLTFYSWNRVYLIGYTGLSFLIPFINITPVLERNEMAGSKIVQFIPQVRAFGEKTDSSHYSISNFHASWSAWDFMMLVLLAGVVVMLLRLLIQLISFKKIMKNAQLVSANDVKLYQVNQPIIPFSFGNSIFINRQLHSDVELQEIIRHEFVHVRQKHTLDIIWTELLCVLNWYNPFVWLIRKSIRQNLEFIADHKVLQTGLDKKQYQYLLLKVTGNNHFSIASQFNFSSLKKRIAMMNKTKSAKAHLIKFLFVLPLMAVLLVAFRNNDRLRPLVREINSVIINEKKPFGKENAISPEKVNDTIPVQGKANSKGYFVDITGDKENCTVVVKDKNQKEVKRLLLTEWYRNGNQYEYLYGPLPVDPKGVVIAANPDEKPQAFDIEGETAAKDLKRLELNDDLIATITLNNGKIEKYDLNKKIDKKTFEKKYGPVISALPKGNKPVQVIKSTISYTSPEVAGVSSSSSAKSADIYIASSPGKTSAVETNVEPAEPVSPAKTFDNVNGEIILDIKGNMPESKVKEMIAGLKNKGYDILINALEYHNGKIALFKGTISANGRKNNFEASDFLRFVISDAKTEDGEKEFNYYIGSGSLVWQ